MFLPSLPICDMIPFSAVEKKEKARIVTENGDTLPLLAE